MHYPTPHPLSLSPSDNVCVNLNGLCACVRIAKSLRCEENQKWKENPAQLLFAKPATLTSISRLFNFCKLLWWSASQFQVGGAWNMTLLPRPWISLPVCAAQIHYSFLRVMQSEQEWQQSATLTLPRCPDKDPLCDNACWPLTYTHTLLVLQLPKRYKGRRILRWRLVTLNIPQVFPDMEWEPCWCN